MAKMHKPTYAGCTPGPFVAEEGVGRGAWVKGSNGNWLALACGETDEEGKANAARLVVACSAHDALVNALAYVTANSFYDEFGCPKFKSEYCPEIVLNALADAGVTFA